MTNIDPQIFQAAPTPPGTVWRPEDKSPAVPVCPDSVYREDIFETIEQTIKALDGELRELSMDIHGEQK
jgi:hypothetical protein